MSEKNLEEDIGGAPTNSAGGGAVAGIGVGRDGEPGVTKKKKSVLGYVKRSVPSFSKFVQKRGV